MKFVNSMLVAAYLLIVGLTAWSLVQNFGIKEVSVEAEVKEILSVEYPGRLETNTTLLCRYSYNSREYEEKVFREGSCRKGDKINIVIDADHPDIVIRFSQKSKVIFLSVMLGIMAVFAIVLLIESFRLSNPKVVSVSSSGKITAKKTTTTGAFRPSKAFSVITLKKGNVEIAKCAVDVMPRLQFSTKTRTAKKGTTLKVFLPDAATSSSSSNSKVVKNMCNTCYADSHGNHYLKLKCQNKGTATITFQVYPKNTNKKVYVSKKIFRFKITVK